MIGNDAEGALTFRSLVGNARVLGGRFRALGGIGGRFGALGAGGRCGSGGATREGGAGGGGRPGTLGAPPGGGSFPRLSASDMAPMIHARSIMCCFSREVRHVAQTRIFARPIDDRQFLAYAMTLDVDDDVAMVLPIPVPPSSPDDAVRFVDMTLAPKFFDALEALFPAPAAYGFGAPQSRAAGPPRQRLVVHEVGDFEASFVPTLRDFDRIDPRFRLAPEVWSALPQYADWGFCVFKLRVGAGNEGDDVPVASPAARGGFDALMDRVRAVFGSDEAPPHPAPSQSRVGAGGERKRHPMAFEFPRRDPTALFFPTVHVHDGIVHAEARFDHVLFAQGIAPGDDWATSAGPPSRAGVAEDVLAFLAPQASVYRRSLAGTLPNRDTIATVG